MAHEPEEVIKQQMFATRASLAEKLETLEQQVIGTVQSATHAVADTVESVKEAVHETVAMAKASVQDTVEAVKQSLDLPRQVQAHPWMMFGGAVAVGYAGGRLLERPCLAATTTCSERAPSLSTLAAHPQAERDGGPPGNAAAPSAATAAAATQHNLLGELGKTFEAEITKLKGLALGTMLGIVRDLIVSAAPPQLGPDLAEIIDSATVKLGGKPIKGPVLDMFQSSSARQEQAPSGRGIQDRGAWGATRSSTPGAAGTID